MVTTTMITTVKTSAYAFHHQVNNLAGHSIKTRCQGIAAQSTPDRLRAARGCVIPLKGRV
jgi:hypothetical protein